jgi:hypothetical protein
MFLGVNFLDETPPGTARRSKEKIKIKEAVC